MLHDITNTVSTNTTPRRYNYSLALAVFGIEAPRLQPLKQRQGTAGHAYRMAIDTSKRYKRVKLQGTAQSGGAVIHGDDARGVTIRELYYQVAENLAPIERRRGDHYVSQQSPTRVERRVHMQFLLRIPLAQTGKRRSCL